MRLNDKDIMAALDKGEIAITPRPSADRISGVSLDLLLGNEFRVFQVYNAPYIDLSGNKEKMAETLNQCMSDEIYIPDGEAFILHPNGSHPENGRTAVGIAPRFPGAPFRPA